MDKIIDICCPFCGKLLLRIIEGTNGTLIPFCKRCGVQRITLPQEMSPQETIDLNGAKNPYKYH